MCRGRRQCRSARRTARILALLQRGAWRARTGRAQTTTTDAVAPGTNTAAGDATATADDSRTRTGTVAASMMLMRRGGGGVHRDGCRRGRLQQRLNVRRCRISAWASLATAAVAVAAAVAHRSSGHRVKHLHVGFGKHDRDVARRLSAKGPVFRRMKTRGMRGTVSTLLGQQAVRCEAKGGERGAGETAHPRINFTRETVNPKGTTGRGT